MDFQNTLFSMPLLTGLIFIIIGFIVLKYPPKKINHLYGYRTKNSMKSQQLWNFAQTYSSKLMIYGGLSLAISSIFGLLLSVTTIIGVIISTYY